MFRFIVFVCYCGITTSENMQAAVWMGRVARYEA
jgi:hypothetical protein